MSRLHPKITITLFREEKCFGPGIAALLSAVKEHRSLRSAAISMDMAYSKAWKILRNCEKELNCKLLQSTIGGKHGGGAVLTAEAEALLEAYTDYCRKVRAFAEEAFGEHFRPFTDIWKAGGEEEKTADKNK